MRRPALQNWVRPLQGPKSILHVAREERYFADLLPWNNRDSYIESAALIAGTACETVGIDINNLQLEYPLMALLRERKASIRFLHTGVSIRLNASGRLSTSHHVRSPASIAPAIPHACNSTAGSLMRFRPGGSSFF